MPLYLPAGFPTTHCDYGRAFHAGDPIAGDDLFTIYRTWVPPGHANEPPDLPPLEEPLQSQLLQASTPDINDNSEISDVDPFSLRLPNGLYFAGWHESGNEMVLGMCVGYGSWCVRLMWNQEGFYWDQDLTCFVPVVF